MTIPHDTAGSPSWADQLAAAVSSVRDMRTELLELNARAAVMTEAIDALVARVIDEHAAEIHAEALRLERDPIDAGLLGERLPRG